MAESFLDQVQNAMDETKKSTSSWKDFVSDYTTPQDLLAHASSVKLAQWLSWSAHTILKSRWTEAEPYIAKDKNASLDYAHDVLKGRFLLGEELIRQNPTLALYYANHVVNKIRPDKPRGKEDDEFRTNPWPEGEEAIASKAGTAYWYAYWTIQRRFPLGEAKILADSYYGPLYRQKFGAVMFTRTQ